MAAARHPAVLLLVIVFASENAAEAQGHQTEDLAVTVAELKKLVSMLHEKNVALEKRVIDLERCDCHTTSCFYKDVVRHSGEVFYENDCTKCRCQNGQVTCSSDSSMASCKDFCQPNPCLNGGLCRPSRWSVVAPELVQCLCPPGFEGTRCERTAEFVCGLPRQTGDCSNFTERWHYNHRARRCESFTYSGCSGNANNFASAEQCMLSCQAGSCCYRAVSQRSSPNATYGFSYRGYDRYGYSSSGYDAEGRHRTLSLAALSEIHSFRFTGYDWQGFEADGFSKNGIDRQGYDRNGYHVSTGYNRTGFNRQGVHDGKHGYGSDGFDSSGYARDGYNRYGVNRDGYDSRGLFAALDYGCEYMSLDKCQNLENERPSIEVLQFTAGKRCTDTTDDADAHKNSCKCSRQIQLFFDGRSPSGGCNRRCLCPNSNTAFSRNCINRNASTLRKEVRDMTAAELARYRCAVARLTELGPGGRPSAWTTATLTRATHAPHAHRRHFLPWHRRFLAEIELALQEVANDRSLYIPYFDWTVDSSDISKSLVWRASIFGGTGDSASGCVRFNPFSCLGINPFSRIGLGSPHEWSPCLQRQFDKSVVMPNPAVIEAVLREQTLASFDAKLKTISSLFHAFVGGHMATPYAAYDPVFLSHYAFLDKLWDEWQTRNKGRPLDVDTTHRYKPMEPFGVAVDDVLFSKDQLCISYVPLASNCRADGDRLSTNASITGVYDAEGFDPNGYDRSGFDIMGYNKQGYRIDGFNADGLDSRGYDRQGYDKYGYRRDGWSWHGLHRNGSYMQSTETPASVATFDGNGYNRFGLDRYGMDMHGRDASGYDAAGQDSSGCDAYFGWGEHLKSKRRVEVELQACSADQLARMARTCAAPVSDPPSWWFGMSWLPAPGPLCWLPVFRQATLTETSKTRTPNLWQPQGPGLRFCIAISWSDGCRLGEDASDWSSCGTDLCSGARCQGYPSAQCWVVRCGGICHRRWSFQGQVITPQCLGCVDARGAERPEGSKWQSSENSCEVCTCEKGIAYCTNVTCPPAECTHPITTSGFNGNPSKQCCQQCRGCEFEGALYSNGATFTHPTESCRQCRCQWGNITCSTARVSCPELSDCRPAAVATLPGSCCPTCTDCGSRRDQERWTEQSCLECTCEKGQAVCRKLKCAKDCTHPVAASGQCCPTCTDCMYKGTVHRDGSIFQQPETCEQCQCYEGNVRCDEQPCPQLRCHRPVKAEPGQCCPRCPDGCEYRGKGYANGTKFTPDHNSCLECQCSYDGSVKCSRLVCPDMSHLPCQRPATLPGQCCPSFCPKCHYDGRDYEHGDQWLPVGRPCEVCVCYEGVLSCRQTKTCSVSCSHGTYTDGECCSPCTDCSFESSLIADGQSFVRAAGGSCYDCACRRGSVTCHETSQCPKLTCTVTQQVLGSCCPICKGCRDEHGIPRQYHEEWQESSPGQCERVCTCIEGIVRCRQKECPTPSCRFPEERPGSCCPICTECSAEGRTYRSGESFISRSDPCRACLCENGTVACSQMSCPAVSCPNPLRSEGRCCPTCPISQCKHLGITMTDGQSMEDGCDVCQCTAGRMTCRRRVCPPPSCSHPKPGACCLECHDCYVDGAAIQHGTQFPQASNPCGVCRCNRGDIECSARVCPSVDCLHPSNDTCCPTCNRCHYEGATRSHREMFSPIGDRCHTCLCSSGTVTCSQDPCPPAPCANPTKAPGECCSRCTDCLYNGDVLADGSSITDGCQECSCSSGVVQCRRIRCLPINCSHPADGDCCPSCNNCFYSGRKVADGDRFTHPADDCLTCTCSAGSVLCSPRACPSVLCSHAAEGPCGCGDCHRCFFDGITYAEGDAFPDRDSPCNVCQCQLGNVKCQRAQCKGASGLAAACSHPVYDDCGCPLCGDCSYEGLRYSNGALVNHSRLSLTQPCSQCNCLDGTINCQLNKCPPLTCHHPGRGQCCSECSGCSYFGKELQNGEVVADPEDTCKTCSCQDGSVSCSATACGLVSCTHPAPDACCPSCSRCLYEEVVYDDGTRFSIDNGCTTCHCKEGSVICSQKDCIRQHCPFVESSKALGGCCDTCQGCLVEDVLHVHGTAWPSRGCGEACGCHGGVVTCTALECVTPCTAPIRSASSHCCPLCPGCVLGGRSYSEGDLFVHPSNPCVQCHCTGGNLACMKRPCPSTAGCPSDHLLPPEAGQCCWTCSSSFNESCSTAMAGRTMQPSSDPCFTCTCIGGHWTCSSDVCSPAQPCDTATGLVQLPGECCPVCPICSHKGSRYENGTSWTDADDPCLSCTCKNGLARCDVTSVCPDLVCSRGTVMARRTGECCPLCLETVTSLPPLDGSCRDGDTVHEDGDRWRVDECMWCDCSEGETICSTEACGDVNCASDEVATLLPGVCCPSCIKQPATCFAYGDPHYRTFDGDTIHFQGFCRYTMAADCVGKLFSVETEHDHRNTSSVSWVYGVNVRLNGTVEIKLRQGASVEVDGLAVSLPFLLEPVVSIERRGGSVLVNTVVGLKVHWDGESHVEVKVSGDYKERMCGLCGNFNNFPQDDMKTKQGIVTSSPAVFGNSWRVLGSSDSTIGCHDAVDVDPCAQAGYHAKRNAAAKCSVLMGRQFARCHRVIPPDAYYASCTYDMCACYDQQAVRGTPGDCLCDVLSSYASACSQAGVILNWRTASLCSIDCDITKGFIFDDCGPPCPRTCSNYDRPPGQMEPGCYKPCVPSCQCPAGRVLHDGHCMSPSTCPPRTVATNRTAPP